MKTIQKLISMMMITTLITSQIGCAGKVTKISEPMDQVKFDKDYNYSLKLKTGEETRLISGDQIHVQQNQLLVKTPNKSESLMSQNVEQINAVSKESQGTNALRGLTIGALAVGIPAGLLFGLVAKGFSDWGKNENGKGSSAGAIIGIGLVGGIVGAAAGGVLGLGIGALIPKHNHIQITPIIEPTKTGSVNAGANVGVTF